MTDHDHMPPITKRGARWISPGKIMVVVNDRAFVLAWDEAHALATAIIEQLQLERRP